VSVHALAVQSTTLDDVFVHYTGRGLRDALQDANPQDSQFMIRRVESTVHLVIWLSGHLVIVGQLSH